MALLTAALATSSLMVELHLHGRSSRSASAIPMSAWLLKCQIPDALKPTTELMQRPI